MGNMGETENKDATANGMPSLGSLKECLCSMDAPMAKRTHAAFYLRTLGGDEAVLAIGEALKNPKDSALLRHELAYILGQMQNKSAMGVLKQVLRDTSDDCMVRHEAAEALGALGDSSVYAILEEFASDQAVEVSETCKLALDLIRWREENKVEVKEGVDLLDKNPYQSVDPAPADRKETPTAVLREQLLDASASLFKRYRAMFSLRNRGGDEAVLALCDGFDDPSALFRHEVAYVLGQVQDVVSVPALCKVLENQSEHRMVRHEAAEALGSIGGATAERCLKKYLDDEEICVKESCLVALDTMDYWGNQFTNK